MVGDLLGYHGQTFTAVVVDIRYFAGDIYVASSVAIIPIMQLEKEGLTLIMRNG